mmetsp:Transcript_19046/g.31177  ORF Transcript_19046/g.31177 Transcript_19046/m.31177 type:complete len:130 (+) Transcript_19046:629-1018(+)
MKTLCLDNNEIAQVPNEIGEMVLLRELNLRANKLESVPRELGNLQCLETLILSSNQLTSFLGEAELERLRGLKKLLLNGNNLEIFPQGLLHLSSCRISIANNNINEIPENVNSKIADINTFGQQKSSKD